MKKPAILIVLVLLSACGESAGDSVQGYVEGDFLRVGLPSAGRVVEVAVARGDHVAAGQTLFALDADGEKAALAEAEAKLAQAIHQRDDLLTGKRTLEIKALEAERAQAKAAHDLALIQLRRQEAMAAVNATSREKLDQARAEANQDAARVAELDSQVAFAHEGGRQAQIAAAEAAVKAGEAALAHARWALGERTAQAPADALVDDVLFRPGETVSAGQPVVSLLPPGNIKLRFYLPPKMIARVPAGTRIGLACEGCPSGLEASVIRVAAEASYAPPVLYSREGKDKLVFLVEARPAAQPERFRPGQPVTLTLPTAAAQK